MPGKTPWFATICGNSGTIIGIWLTQPSGVSDSAAARTQGASSSAFLASGETFGVRLGAAALQKFVADAWKGLTKSFDTSGRPNNNGPIFLTSYNMDLSQQINAGTMKMTINGYYSGPVNIPFTVQVADILTKSGGKISCSNTNSVDVDTSKIEALIAVSVFTAPFMVPALVDALHQADSYTQLPSGVLPDSQKCVAKNAIPDSIPLTGGIFKGKKVDFQYTRLVVNNNVGIIAAGTWSLVARQPSVQILGPSSIKGEIGQDKVYAFYTIQTLDMVRPFKSAVWTASGALTQTSGTSSSGWPTLSVEWPGQSGTKTVGITVKDVDDLVASATKSTTIKLTVDGLPPVCTKKPYLPQCQ